MLLWSMGLDSVELLVAFEEYFQISIPDQEAEQLYTVGQAADCVARLRGIPLEPGRSAVYQTVFQQVLPALRQLHPSPTEGTLLFSLDSPYNHTRLRQQLAAALSLQVPPLPKLQRPPAQRSWVERVFNIPSLMSSDLSGSVLADLTDWLVSYNYQILLPVPSTLYEVQRAVVGLSSDRLGIGIPEIRLTDSFTHDLGVD